MTLCTYVKITNIYHPAHTPQRSLFDLFILLYYYAVDITQREFKKRKDKKKIL